MRFLFNRYSNRATWLLAWRACFWMCVVAVLVLSLMPPAPHMPSTGWDKANHALAFAVLAWLGCSAWPGRTTRVLCGLLAFGVLIEGLQSLTPYRVAEWADLLADVLGLALGWGAWAVSVAARRRVQPV